jgi:putative pyruvate formate lyase activating enzyme
MTAMGGYGTHEAKEITTRARHLLQLQQPICQLCPRRCGVKRPEGTCRQPRELQVAVVCRHMGEEPCLSGSRGAGTIFVAGCTMKCGFCQNHQISQAGPPDPGAWTWTPGALAERFLRLQDQGAHNIEWVSATQHLPGLAEALGLAREAGLVLPVVLNTNGYERLEVLQLLEGLVDIYLPDAKYGLPSLAGRLSRTPDYVEVNRAALLEMQRQVGPLELDRDGLARRGLLVRHLVLPGHLDNTREVLRWLASHLGPDSAWISVMAQYYPAHRATDAGTELARRITRREYDQVLATLEELELNNGWIQERATGEDFLPDFLSPDPFGTSPLTTPAGSPASTD